jgi:hypothetical protein
MRIETLEEGSFDVIGVGRFVGGDCDEFPFLLFLCRSEADGLRFEEFELVDEDPIGVFDDEEERPELIAALRDHVILVVVGLERREGHDEHLDADEEVLPERRGTSMQ